MRMLLLLIGLMVGNAAAASLTDLSAADRGDIRATITAQVAAFARDDDEGAFGLASPAIQDLFRTPEGFMAMVRQGYQQVYRPQVFEFQDVVSFRGQPTQRVFVVGPEGDAVIASYIMARQPDGSWRIDGCILEPVPDVAA